MTTENIFFALIGVALAAFTVWSVLVPLWRTRAADAAGATDIDIYRDQLAEVDRDLARGVLEPVEAERTRTEISRRLLAADTATRATASEAPTRLSRMVAAIVGVGLLAGTGALYVTLGAPGYGDIPRATRIAVGEERRENRPSQLDAEAIIAPVDSLSQFDEATQDLIQTRRAAVFEQPQNLQAWSVLSQTEAAIGQFQRATRAQERIVALKGPDAAIEDFSTLLDLMVASTQGYVSPEAEAVALTVLRQDAGNIPALYYAGLMYAQNDRPDRAFDLWRRVIEDGEQDSLHWNFAANQIEDVAAQLGIDYVLPDRRGPSADDIAAAQGMAPEDQRAMIQGMVEQLADRLATDGGPPHDWARLISSLAVLGENDTALTVLAEAEAIFGADIQAVTIVRRAAADAGLTE